MPSSNLANLLKLPVDERAELAMALWESLSDQERESELELSSDQKAAELERRWADHLANPESAIPWEEVRRKLRDGKGPARLSISTHLGRETAGGHGTKITKRTKNTKPK